MPLRFPAALAASFLLLVGAALLSAGTAHAAEFTDSAGRRVLLPDTIGGVMPAEPNAEALLFVLAPERLAGQSRYRRGSRRAHPTQLSPVNWAARSTPAGMAAVARQAHPDLI